jgi:hypothetical protein
MFVCVCVCVYMCVPVDSMCLCVCVTVDCGCASLSVSLSLSMSLSPVCLCVCLKWTGSVIHSSSPKNTMTLSGHHATVTVTFRRCLDSIFLVDLFLVDNLAQRYFFIIYMYIYIDSNRDI